MTYARWRILLGGAALVVAVDGCTWRGLPLPPPTASRVQPDTCAPPLCPDGGVEVTIVGRATPGALIVVENSTRRHADGRRYNASAWAAEVVTAGDAGSDASADGGASTGPDVQYIVVLRAEHDPDGTVTVSQLGDELSIVQFVRNDQGLWQQSTTGYLIVR